ncbi:GIN domain-containing protein [Candidatus Symbiothrix dinenymphae]|uniref:GIN domain-containing protein n=1 Tax=Candidatus Symbiothrix dinenymphae TaxID=467085 RepID=UPI0006BFAF18|nr:DUF2807 domain-containing protein [Candidatus Symbiothrix dinenymphae]GAP71813.1 hypothetical protein SAMD00024442_19_13 [Candidatus Symbiothrix dinenymphae]
MKKTISVNLNGRVFTIDEDAYQLLDNYLRNLKIHFRKEKDSSEIIADFEIRIAELFNERIRLGYEVINIGHVEEMIARIGKPADFSDTEDEYDAEKSPHSSESKNTKKRFYRDSDDKLIAGLCSGLAAYFNTDVLPIRIIAIVLFFVPPFPVLIIYLVLWIFVPEAKTAEEKLKMRGQAVTVENIGKIVADATEDAKKFYHENKGGFLSGCVRALAGFFKVCLVILGLLVGVPLIFALFTALIVVFSLLFGLSNSLVGFPFFLGGIGTPFFELTHPVLAAGMLIILLIIPLGVLIYTIVAHFKKLKPVHIGIKWAGFGVWLLALILLVSSGCRIHHKHFHRNWNVHFSHGEVFEGNGVQAEKSIAVAEAIERVIVEDHLIANLQIEQVAGESTTILVSGDENLIDKISANWENGELRLSVDNNSNLRPQKNFNIIVQTPTLKAIVLNSVGKIVIPNLFKSNELNIALEGAGHIQADSLAVQSLTVHAEGVGSITVAGTAKNADLHLDGAGEIEAANLLSDTVTAHLEGIGKIACNPTLHLAAKVEGIGKITYKTEPKTMQQVIVGLGKIKKQ